MNWSDFFAMGGYGLYVWGSYSVTALCMIVEIIFLLRRKRTLLQRLSRIGRRSGSRINQANPEIPYRDEFKHEDRV